MWLKHQILYSMSFLQSAVDAECFSREEDLSLTLTIRTEFRWLDGRFAHSLFLVELDKKINGALARPYGGLNMKLEQAAG